MTHLILAANGEFKSLKSGYKTFLIAKTDRTYSVDDIVIVQGYENGESTSKLAELTFKIDYVDLAASGLKKDFCILGIKEKENL